MITIGSAPYRISLFGGGTDYPAWYAERPGLVINVALAKWCHVAMVGADMYHGVMARPGDPVTTEVAQRLGMNQWRIYSIPEMPIGAGLGGSSAYAVALLHAATNGVLTKMQLAEMAIRYEREYAGMAVGDQDQIAAAFGGANAIAIDKGGRRRVMPIDIDWLEPYLYIVFTEAIRDGRKLAELYTHPRARSYLTDVLSIAREALDALVRQDIAHIGALVRAGWEQKKSVSSHIAPSNVLQLEKEALRQGALAVRLMGAGGSGYMLVMAERDAAERMRRAGMALEGVKFNRTGAILNRVGA